MVTRTADSADLAALIAKSNSKTWDLIDMTKKDAWLLTTEAALRQDPDVWTAVTIGPPTAELIMEKAPGTDPANAAAQATALLPSWKEKSILGYGILLPRLDFHKNVALAQSVARKAGAKQDGHALWQIILSRLDTLSDERHLKAGSTFFRQNQDLNHRWLSNSRMQSATSMH